MSKKLITKAIVGLALLSSAYASDEPNNATSVQNTTGVEVSYCQKATLKGKKITNVDLAKIIEDAYSIQHHGEYRCDAISEQEAVEIEKGELYAFLLGMQISGNTLPVSRIEKAKMSFFYEVIVSKAIESDIDTVAGIQKKILGKNETKETKK